MAESLPYFFYGTLMDPDLLARVVGHPVDTDRTEPARIVGYRRTGVVGRGYPIILRRPGGRVDGLLVHGLGGRAARRLAAYEGANYRLVAVTAHDSRGHAVPAVGFEFVGGLTPDRKIWRLDRWQRRWKRRALRRAGRLTSWAGED